MSYAIPEDTEGTGSVGFNSARTNLVHGWFASPRIIIDIDGTIMKNGGEVFCRDGQIKPVELPWHLQRKNLP